MSAVIECLHVIQLVVASLWNDFAKPIVRTAPPMGDLNHLRSLRCLHGLSGFVPSLFFSRQQHEGQMNICLRRREFIAGLGGAAAWPLAARAQQAWRVRRIGVLIGGSENDPERETRLSEFTQALAGLGWTDGRNVRMEFRWVLRDNLDENGRAAIGM
jgi:hypothetical protein